jgi:ATP-binding cassette subfamily B multidrug efflux pump
LRSNIALGCPDATEEEIVKAVELAALSDDIALFKDGLDTIVGERGITLSGGQRQRVCLARAIIMQPRVLLLDDSMSAVDAETELRILASLKGGFGSNEVQENKRTIFIVSHRLAAMPAADHIYVLHEGAVAEEGLHADLLAKDGIYADLWGRAQIKKQLGEMDD